MNQHDVSNLEASLFNRWGLIKEAAGVNLRALVDHYAHHSAREAADVGIETEAWHERQCAEDRLLAALENIIINKEAV